MIQPKPFLDKFKLRHHSIGQERRLNMTKLILEHRPNFPLSVEYTDIDNAVFEWVKNTLDIGFEGKQLPTYRLFSNQRINEYAQSWQHLDDTGNLLLNFKTITRDNNPQKGEIYGSQYNIPGNRDYPMFAVSTLQENGQEAIDLYTMKQPMAIDFVYTINIITNKYELLNEFNQLVNYQFKARQCYISPNNHPMSMLLDSVSDESEYTIDDRKYYSQAFKVKVLGYIIRQEDYKVTRIPTRWTTRFIGVKDTTKKKNKPTVQIEELTCPCNNINEKEQERYTYRKMELNVEFPMCNNTVDFIIDTDISLEDIELTNIYDFLIYINEEQVDVEEDEINFLNGDKITVEIERDDAFKDAKLTIKGFNPNEVVDNAYDPESALDEQIEKEIIDYKNDEEME